MKQLKLGILKDYHYFHENYVKACEHEGIPYEVIDLLSPSWLSQISGSDCDGFLCHPPNDIQERKLLVDERVFTISSVLKKPVYPGFNELFIYENKRLVSYWLKANGFPHPETSVFTGKREAVQFLDEIEYPLVFKTNIGAGASGVEVIHNKRRAKCIAGQVFGYSHPALTFGRVRFSRKFHGIPLPLLGRVQKHYLIVQKYYPIRWEWRIIRIGDSWFGHQKLLKDGFASGSDLVGWVPPPERLLEMAMDICEKGGFRSMALDIFETLDGRYLVNELQSIFGSYLDSQMLIDGKPGRFIHRDGAFVFEEGVFNQFGSHLLRVRDFIQLLRSGYYSSQ